MSLTLRAFLFAIVLAFVPCQLLGQPDRIPENLDPRDLVTIGGNVNPKAQAQFDQGPADLSLRLDRITLMLKPATDQQGALETLLRDQQDPAPRIITPGSLPNNMRIALASAQPISKRSFYGCSRKD